MADAATDLIAVWQGCFNYFRATVRMLLMKGSLKKKVICKKMQISSSDKPTTFYSLDVIISVGYRVKSQEGVRFRKSIGSIKKKYFYQLKRNILSS